MEPDTFDTFSDGLVAPALVVTAATERERSGCLVGFATQCSIDPPRMLVCISKANHTYGVAAEADHLGVHVLGKDAQGLADLFGGTTGDVVDKFARCTWEEGPAGVPLIDGPTHRMVGRVIGTHDLGDHVGFVLEPVHVDTPDSAETMSIDEVDVEPGHPA